MRRDFLAGIAGVILLILAAGGVGGIDSWAGEAKAVPPAAPGVAKAAAGTPAAAPPPAKAVYGPYAYQAAGKPDPFRPFIEMDLALLKKRQEEQLKKASPKERPFSPLQQADLASFRLVGIAGDQDQGTAAAVVEDRTRKKFYPLFVGTYIGLNEGRVASIRPDRVIVEEPTGAPAKKGQKAQMKRVSILLHKDQ